MEQFFIVNAVTDEWKVAALSIICGKTYVLLKSLVPPAAPASKSYTELVQVLRDHLSLKPLVIAERFRFHKRNQKEGETVLEFIAEIKRIAETCEFGIYLSEALRDRLVCGLSNEATQKRLLAETSGDKRRQEGRGNFSSHGDSDEGCTSIEQP